MNEQPNALPLWEWMATYKSALISNFEYYYQIPWQYLSVLSVPLTFSRLSLVIRRRSSMLNQIRRKIAYEFPNT